MRAINDPDRLDAGEALLLAAGVVLGMVAGYSAAVATWLDQPRRVEPVSIVQNVGPRVNTPGHR